MELEFAIANGPTARDAPCVQANSADEISPDAYPFSLLGGSPIVIDWEPMLRAILAEPFFNEATNSVNVMYRLNKGAYGLLVPALE